MIELINVHAGLNIERELASHGLASFSKDNGIEQKFQAYGCGSFVPGECYDRFVTAYSTGELLGIVGMTVEEDILACHPAELRSLLGQVLGYSPNIFTTDQTSAEWALHYSMHASHGGHPAWLASAEVATKAVERTGRNADLLFVDGASGSAEAEAVFANEAYDIWCVGSVDIWVVRDLGAAIAAALLHIPCIYCPKVRDLGYKKNFLVNHHLTRFATRFGMRSQMAMDIGQLRVLIENTANLVPVDLALVESAKIEAIVTLQRMIPQVADASRDQVHDALSVFAVTSERVVNPSGGESMNFAGPAVRGAMPKELVLGSVFDPTTHYDEYYYGDGPGLVYSDPSGNKVRYPGPARDWEGFDVVAQIFKIVFEKDQCDSCSILSLGCGFGYDVLRFCRAGWNAYGMDISKWSTSQAPVEVKDKILCRNILDDDAFAGLPGFDVVCSFDFWEHIWLRDIDDLLERLYDVMIPGSFMANIICTRTVAEKDWTMRQGVKFSKENSWLLASGHVTIRRWMWWANKFVEHGFKVRNDLAYEFQVARTENPLMCQSMSWRAKNLLIVER